MRLGAFVILAGYLAVTTAISAQDYATSNPRSSKSVLLPAQTVAWRNHVTVPDGPCGCAMTVEADCYNDCPHHCNPFRFLHRVGRMLDCFKPCNLCCGTGGCGLIHGGKPGHCSMCCGVACSGDCGGCGHSSCSPNPCGSVFSSCRPSCGCCSQCTGCGCPVPALGDPFVDDPPLPKPSSEPASEVRRAPAPRVRQTTPAAVAAAPRPASAVVKTTTPMPVVAKPATPAQVVAKETTPAPRTTPYKVVQARQAAVPAAAKSEQPKPQSPTTSASKRTTPAPSQSVLRRASAENESSEQKSAEPAPLVIDRSAATPIRRLSQPVAIDSDAIPTNPLR